MKYKINETVLNIMEAGVENYNQTRPTLVFLHYFGGSSRAWTEVVEQLAKGFSLRRAGFARLRRVGRAFYGGKFRGQRLRRRY